MNKLVIHQKEFMHPEDAMTICDYARSVDGEFKSFGNIEKEFTFHADFKDSEAHSLLNDYGLAVHQFVRESYKTDIEPIDLTKTHIARFGEGYGMHEHFDSSRPNDIATLIYLNNDYEGGEIYFPELDISIKPKAGDLVCFPDTPDFIHGVRPISKGIRYTTPRWFTRIV